MGFTGEQRHLADGFAGGHGGDEASRTFLLVDEDAERAGHDQKHGPIVFAGARELRAARNAEPIGLGEEPP